MKETVYKIKGLPIDRIALLGDFHNGNPEPVLSSMRSRHPSIICIAGDLFYNRKPADGHTMLSEQSHILPLLTGCTSLAPTFMSLGNHESRVTEGELSIISGTGVSILDDEWTRFEINGKLICVGGLTSQYIRDFRAFYKAYPDFDSLDEEEQKQILSEWRHIKNPDLDWLRPIPSGEYTLLMSHHPEYFPDLPSGVGLVLSAHSHGGQARIFNPIKWKWQGIYAPGQGFFPKYTKGLYSRPDETQMIVTSGLTNTARVPRFFNPTEVVYLTSQDPTVLGSRSPHDDP